tara:strand:+ start:31 stop:2256 length:2226 start_codon:yes stop_codon:yes gene_type:complete
MLTQVNYEVKGQLAKLLATEDLIIENRKVPTASFDVEKRVLTLPMWEKASGTVYDLLVGHEVGHALYTPADNWQLDYPQIPMCFVNVFEDVRIEKLMKQKYPGLGKTFYSGYSQLSDQDFFEIDDKDQEEINLVDRINLQYKVGNFVNIEFEDDEKIFVEKAIKTQTFEDVLKLSQELTDFLKDKMDNLEKTQVPMSNGEEGGSMDIPFDATEDSDDQTDNDPFEGSGKPDTEESDELLDQPSMPTPDGVGGVHSELESETDKALQENLEELSEKVNENSMYYDPEYIKLPELNMNTLIAKNEDIHEYLDDWWKQCQKHYDDNEHLTIKRDIFEPVDNDYRLFRRSAQKEVNYLVKEFECKKSADAYARATVSKTGILDCTKLHTYKYNEDLFRKITTIPDGKNHGLIFVLDWSGSMSSVLMDTVKQLFNLIWFCKKVQIPFQVFAFTNEWQQRHEDYLNDDGYYNRIEHPEHHEKKDGYAHIDSQFSMMEFLTSECKKGDLENQLLNIWRVAKALTCHRGWNMPVMYQSPRNLSLSGTPLNEALVSLNQIIPRFQKKHNVQKIQCITLTDGEAHPLKYTRHIKARYEGGEDYLGSRSAMNGHCYIRDPKNGKTYYCKSEYHELTSALLYQLRGRFPQVNFLGIRVLDNRDASHFIRKYVNWDFDKVQSIQSGWKKNKSICLNDVGYHAYFGLSSTNLNNDTEFEVREDATKAQIKSAFKKSLNSKRMNKKVLGEFMEYIA